MNPSPPEDLHERIMTAVTDARVHIKRRNRFFQISSTLALVILLLDLSSLGIVFVRGARISVPLAGVAIGSLLALGILYGVKHRWTLRRSTIQRSNHGAWS